MSASDPKQTFDINAEINVGDSLVVKTQFDDYHSCAF